VIEFKPAAKLDVVSMAVPLVRVAEPRGVVPSRKVTVPVGTRLAKEIFAVSVTAFSISTGLALLVITAKAAALLTKSETVCVAEL
jgi:hypothetical protein